MRTSDALAWRPPSPLWRAAGDRGPLLASAVLALAVHVAATVLIDTHPRSGAGAPLTSAVTTFRLLAAESPGSGSSAQPAPRPPASALRAARPKVKPTVATPRRDAAGSPERNGGRPAPAAAPAVATVDQYRIARRSAAFGGAREREAGPPATTGARPLDAWISEGIARSVWAVAGELAAAGDGSCKLAGREAQVACDSAELESALARSPEPALHALATWVRGGFVQSIEIRIDGGRATYAVAPATARARAVPPRNGQDDPQ